MPVMEPRAHPEDGHCVTTKSYLKPPCLTAYLSQC